jgi:hypothetical protein
MKRSGRSVLSFGGSGRVLRFPSRSRTTNSERGALPEENALYVSIGRIAANWSLLEIVSGLVLTGLLGSDEETLAQAVVAGQRVESVWDTTEAVLATYGDPVADHLVDFRSWRRSANGYRRRRNEAIHSAWSLTESSGKAAAWDMMSQKAKRGARGDLFPGGVPELEELARDIADCESRLTLLHESIHAAMDAPRQAPGEAGQFAP